MISGAAPGVFARAEVVFAEFDEILVIPLKAVIKREDRDNVFVVSGGTAVARDVVLGTDFDGRVEVREGLNPGDTIIVVGQNYLDNGYKVNLVRLVTS